MSAEDVTLGEIHRTMTRIEQKVDKVTDDHEVRLRRVEKWMYAVPPTVVAAVTSVVVQFLTRR